MTKIEIKYHKRPKYNFGNYTPITLEDIIEWKRLLYEAEIPQRELSFNWDLVPEELRREFKVYVHGVPPPCKLSDVENLPEWK